MSSTATVLKEILARIKFDPTLFDRHAEGAHLVDDVGLDSIEMMRFMLEIEDNGHGLPGDAADKGRNGLRNMRKRLEDIGGQFTIGPGAEGGTCVCLTAPLGKPTVGTA